MATLRLRSALIAGVVVALAGAPATAGAAARLAIPSTADQLIVVSSPTDDPPAPG